MIIALYERPEVETPVISAPALYSTVLKTKSLANPGVLELAPKVVPVSTLSDMAVSQMTRVSIIPAVYDLVWYNAGSSWGFSTDFRGKAGISSGRHPTGITNSTGVLDSAVSD